MDATDLSHLLQFVYERVMAASQTPYLSGAERTLRVHPATYLRLLRLQDGAGGYLIPNEGLAVAAPLALYGVPLVRDPAVEEGTVVLRLDAQLVLPEEGDDG